MASRQGPHQVAQKSRRTTFPFREVRAISWSSKVLSEKPGAALDSFPLVLQCGRSAMARQRLKRMRFLK
jgi:hypothetical protein